MGHGLHWGWTTRSCHAVCVLVVSFDLRRVASVGQPIANEWRLYPSDDEEFLAVCAGGKKRRVLQGV